MRAGAPFVKRMFLRVFGRVVYPPRRPTVEASSGDLGGAVLKEVSGLKPLLAASVAALSLVSAVAAGSASAAPLDAQERVLAAHTARLASVVGRARIAVVWIGRAQLERPLGPLEAVRLVEARGQIRTLGPQLARSRARLVRVRATGRALESWPAAVELVGRFYGPGLQAWLWSCSSPRSEGGHGRFVMNTQGSGAGGWLQFMAGTFYGVIDAAIADARGRGMLVPTSARSWRSPLGQALAGVRMLAEGRRGEWQGFGC